MVRLALAAGDEATFEGERAMLPVDRRTGDAAARTGGGPVLVYRVLPETFVLFVGRGRIAGIEYGVDRVVTVRLDSYAAFQAPVPATGELHLPRVRAMLSLSDERAAEINRAGRAAPEGPALEESQARLSPETYVAVRDQVLRNWDYRCAITGQRDEPRRGQRPALDVVAIRPREVGGPLHVRNFLPLIPLAARAWERGDISAGPGFDIIAVQNRLDPELLERMAMSGRLVLPDDPMLGPDPEQIAYHRRHVFG